MTEHCSNCGVLCCGKLKIEVGKEKYLPFCSECFDCLSRVKITMIKKIIKKRNI